MRIIFLGSGAFARPTLNWLAQSEHQVVMVITQPTRPSGRGRRLVRTPTGALADELGLETMETPNVNDSEVLDTLRSLDAHLGLVIDFGQKLGSELLDLTPAGFVNLHASLLPKYRGAAPINWAIINGEERTGCTVFRVVERMDAGPVLISRWTAIKPEETAGELHDRLAGIGVDAVQATLPLFENDAPPQGAAQDESEASRAPKLKKTDGIIEFDRPAASVANLICGLTPWPGARARYESRDDRWEQVTITRARRAEDPNRPSIPPGSIDARRLVSAGDGYVEILEIKPSSGRVMTWQDYVNGRHVGEGDRFTAPDA